MSQRHRFKRESRFFKAMSKHFSVTKITEHIKKDIDPQNDQMYRYVTRIYTFQRKKKEKKIII